MTTLEGVIAIVGMALITLVTRAFFLLPSANCRCRRGCSKVFATRRWPHWWRSSRPRS